ncbi:hypothetical protein, partial [Glycomyces sp. MUSA5-2]|uniref:hypothetical protein n=1 Tax=Glycomyces sp. MUSA5-2 TaxID=2053002 RepID=UPI0030080417
TLTGPATSNHVSKHVLTDFHETPSKCPKEKTVKNSTDLQISSTKAEPLQSAHTLTIQTPC